MPTVLAAPAFQWSDLAKKPTEVGKALDAAPVMRDMCALLGAVVATETPERVCAILNAAWPWTRVLPTHDQIELAAEVGPLAETCESLDTWRPLLDALAAWRGTARAWASGASAVGPIANPVNTPVPRP